MAVALQLKQHKPCRIAARGIENEVGKTWHQDRSYNNVTQSILAQNILAQPESLSRVLEHQCGQGAESLAKAAALLRSAKRVLITGMGASLFASIPLEYYLCANGIDAVALESGELLHYRQEGFRDAVTVVVSRSGESIEIKKLLQSLKGRTKIIGICNEPGSTLDRMADVSIQLGSLDDEIVSIQTYTGTLLTQYLLASAVVDTAKTAHVTVSALLPAFAQQVESSFSALGRWDNFLVHVSSLYLLARGPSCASAFEGALLFHEVAKTAAVGMMAGSFRHGPVEVVDASFTGLLFAPQGKTRDLNLALAGDLARFGGCIRVIGPSLEDNALENMLIGCEIPPVPESLAPLFEIVPIQVAALRMAELKGIPPGSFRYAPRVAADEADFNPQRRS
jgi:glucosamine--fructose-6-phosphate aminotransferase (isomerizing)